MTIDELRELCRTQGIPGADLRAEGGWHYVATPAGSVAIAPQGDLWFGGHGDLRERLLRLATKNREEEARLATRLFALRRALGTEAQVTTLERERDEARADLEALRKTVRRAFTRASWWSLTPGVEYEQPTQELAKCAADIALGNYLANAAASGEVDTEAYEVAVGMMLMAWRVADAESGPCLERDPDVAALLEVARG